MDAILNFSKIICKLEIANVNALIFKFKVSFDVLIPFGALCTVNQIFFSFDTN